MQSIPVAMTWEMLKRGRWNLIAFACAANLLPLMLLTGLQYDGALDPTGSDLSVMHLVLIQINVLIFGIALFGAQGPPSRLYALPIRTESLVAWQMLTAMVAMALESLASTALLNAVYGLNWPLWGPALYAAVGVAANLAALWSTEKSGWLPIAVGFGGVPLALWLKSRYGPMFSQPEHLWQEVTPGDVLTLFMFAALSYVAAIIGVARNRCGESLPSLGIVALFERVFGPQPEAGPPFSTPLQAQFWFEWRKKGWALPVIVVFGMFIGMSFWVVFNRDLNDLFEGFVAGGAMLTFMGFLGLVLGGVGPNDATLDIGHFQATRPLTNSEIARTVLKVLARGVLIAWTIWAVPFLLLFAVLSARQAVPPVEILDDLGWWYLPATLLSCWMVVSVLSAMAMTGRSKLLVLVIGGLIVCAIAMILLSTFVLPAHARLPFGRGVSAAVGAVFLLGTGWAFVAATRRTLIGLPMASFSGGVWMLLGVLIVLDWSLHPDRSWLACIFVVGLAALVVAPLAAAPLALAWNRNR